MKVVARSLVWLIVCAITVEAGALPSARAQPRVPASPEKPPVTLVEPGTDVTIAAPEPEGACIGGDCLFEPPRRTLHIPRLEGAARVAHNASIFGAVAAGLVFSGAIAIAVADHPDSERVTRSVWLGTMALSPPIVGLTAYLARRQSKGGGVKSARRLAWVAYSSATTSGVLQVVGAVRDEPTPKWLTISSGVFGVLCLLPLALDALVSARKARVAPARAQWVPSVSGVGVRF